MAQESSQLPHNGKQSARAPFPQSTEEFDDDDRVSWSRLESKWLLEAEDGTEWEFKEAIGKWTSSFEDETLLENQQRAYGSYDAAADEPESSSTAAQRKRKNDRTADDQAKDDEPARKQKKKQQPTERKNTAVYATSIPVDADVDEIHDVFSKYGVIAEEIDSNKSRIKMYEDAEGNFKGDALIVYFRPESVSLAIQMLDDSEFRYGVKGPQGRMRVTEADRSYKKVQEHETSTDKQQQQQADQPIKQAKKQDMKKVIKKTEKMKSKLTDWSDDEDPQTLTAVSSRFDKVVILKHMFTMAELKEDPGAILDIKEDIREECEKMGRVTNVVVFDREEDGVVSVRFGNPSAAQGCIQAMNGRHFDGRIVEARLADGRERYQKEGKDSAKIEIDDANGENDGEDRLGQFSKFLDDENNRA